MISKSQESFISAALVGGAVGAMLALLFTPVSGAELREQVRNGFNHNGVRRKVKMGARSLAHAAAEHLAHPVRSNRVKRAKKKAPVKRKHVE